MPRDAGDSPCDPSWRQHEVDDWKSPADFLRHRTIHPAACLTAELPPFFRTAAGTGAFQELPGLSVITEQKTGDLREKATGFRNPRQR